MCVCVCVCVCAYINVGFLASKHTLILLKFYGTQGEHLPQHMLGNPSLFTLTALPYFDMLCL